MVLAMSTVEIPMQGPKTEQMKEGEREKGLGKSTNTEDSSTKHQGFWCCFHILCQRILLVPPEIIIVIILYK